MSTLLSTLVISDRQYNDINYKWQKSANDKCKWVWWQEERCHTTPRTYSLSFGACFLSSTRFAFKSFIFFCSLARTKNILQLREPFSMLLFTTKYPLLNLILQESAFFLFRFVVGGKTAKKIFRFRCSSSILWNKWAYYSFITLWCLSVCPSICLSSCLLYYNLVFNSCWVLITIFPFFKLNNHIHLYIYIYIHIKKFYLNFT